MNRFTVNPISTGNQPLSVELEYEGARIRSARVGIRGYWNFEKMLVGRHPFDALQVALRINSHLSVAHGLAAAKALESISGMEKPLMACWQEIFCKGANLFTTICIIFTRGFFSLIFRDQRMKICYPVQPVSLCSKARY